MHGARRDHTSRGQKSRRTRLHGRLVQGEYVCKILYMLVRSDGQRLIRRQVAQSLRAERITLLIQLNGIAVARKHVGEVERTVRCRPCGLSRVTIDLQGHGHPGKRRSALRSDSA